MEGPLQLPLLLCGAEQRVLWIIMFRETGFCRNNYRHSNLFLQVISIISASRRVRSGEMTCHFEAGFKIPSGG